MTTVVALKGTRPVKPKPRSRALVSFWLGMVVAIVITVWVYCLPASAKIARQEAELEASQAQQEAIAAQQQELREERDALHDPYYIERILMEQGWRRVRTTP